MENSIGPGPVDSVAVQPHYDEISSKDQENILDHGSVQGVPLKLAVQPNGNPTVSYDMNRWLANGSVKALPISNGNPAAQAQAIHAEPTMNESGSYIPMDSMLADKTFSLVADVRVEAPISPSSTNSDHEAEAPILPPAQNQNQDPMATASVSDQDPVAMESVSDQDPVATASVPDQDPVAIAGETPVVDEVLLPATRLKRRLENTSDLIVCPGVYDGFSARIALSVGFDALYMTGAGTTASRLGQPDLGLAQLGDMRAQADMICNLDPWGTPVIADMDTGYGGPNTVALAVQQYIRANVAGFHIEDQVLTKRCGHLSGKKVVSADVFLSRIRAAKSAKERARSDIVLIARTDANQQLGYDECIARLRAAAALGADVGLLEGFKSKEQAAQAVKDLAPFPLLLNIVENGHSPLITVEEAREMGFRIMIFSIAGLAPAFGAIKGAYERLKREGVTGVQGTGVSPIKIFEVCGLKDCMRIDAEAGGDDFKDGV